MTIRYASGIRLGALTVDPIDRVDVALWTHRPARRPAASRHLASTTLARHWRRTLGLPIGGSAIAMGHRIELLPTGYGPGGAAVLVTRRGRRTLVVGPTTAALEPRHADQLVLHAPAAPRHRLDGAWLDTLRDLEAPVDLVAPDGAAADALAAALTAADLPYRGPRWLQTGPGEADAMRRITTHGTGRLIDLRPQADEGWLVDYAHRVDPRDIFVHGDRADALAHRLAALGHAVRVLHGPQQLALLDPASPPPFVPSPPAFEERGEPEHR